MWRLHRTCKEAAALLVAREDRALAWDDKFALRMHLMVCKACPNFAQQMQTMRQAMRNWRKYSESDQGRSPKP